MDRYVELITQADRAQAEGRLADAEALARKALVVKPSGISAREMLGIVSAKQGNFRGAVPWLKQAASMDPSSFQAVLWLSLSYRSLNQHEMALDAALQAVERDPSAPTGYNQLGLSYLQLNRFRESEAAFRKALELDPNPSSFHENLGHALKNQKKQEEADREFNLAVELDPTGVMVAVRLGNLAFARLEFELTRRLATIVISRNPYHVPTRLLHIKALSALGRSEEAEAEVQEALALIGEDAELRSAYSSILDGRGLREEAEAQIEKSLQINPRQGFAYYGLVRARKVTNLDEPLVSRMERVLSERETQGWHRAYLHYALGKAYEDLGIYQQSMAQYDLANRSAAGIEGQIYSWSKSASRDRTQKAIEFFTREFFESNRNTGSEDDLPIFVVGMMRSGTTLVEQILSSHPQIGGAGEQPFWLQNWGTSVTADHLTSLSHEYSSLLRTICPGLPKVVDKMPNNFLQLGLIHTAFPKAKIVHVRRHPVDTCISLWSTPMACPPDWTGRKDVIVAEYRFYLEYMKHWRSVLPPDRFLDIDYEELISQQEVVTRQMIEFCGLGWDEACLKPEKNQRIVNTPSLAQVRRPVYKSSVARWEKFKPWLGEFSALIPATPAVSIC